MEKYNVYRQVGEQTECLVVKVEGEEQTEYYHITPYSKSNPQLVCDGDGPLCHSDKDCQHIKAARRFLAKQAS